MEHRDDHDGNFYNEENGDHEDEHSCDVQRLLHFLLPHVVVDPENMTAKQTETGFEICFSTSNLCQ